MKKNTNRLNKNRFIYTITAVPEVGHSRCIGYFSSRQKAIMTILKNGINGLDEGGIFKYLVVEKFSSGLYANSTGDENWFIANYKDDCWEKMENKPKKFNGITNYAIG